MKIIASKSFVAGIIKSINITGTKEWPDIASDVMKDYLAIKGDWEYVGEAIKRGSDEFAGARK